MLRALLLGAVMFPFACSEASAQLFGRHCRWNQQPSISLPIQPSFSLPISSMPVSTSFSMPSTMPTTSTSTEVQSYDKFAALRDFIASQQETSGAKIDGLRHLVEAKFESMHHEHAGISKSINLGMVLQHLHAQDGSSTTTGSGSTQLQALSLLMNAIHNHDANIGSKIHAHDSNIGGKVQSSQIGGAIDAMKILQAIEAHNSSSGSSGLSALLNLFGYHTTPPVEAPDSPSDAPSVAPGNSIADCPEGCLDKMELISQSILTLAEKLNSLDERVKVLETS